MHQEELMKKYPWLASTPSSFSEYLQSAYYDHILKQYTFDKKEDLAFLKEAVEKAPSISNSLEMGPGTGRATKVILAAEKPPAKLTLVDLSQQMLQRCKESFSGNESISYVQSDSLDFLDSTKEKYDFVFSLWSFSHSVHQNLHRLGTEEGNLKINTILKKFVTENLNPKATIFIMHFDSLSDEQKISVRQRGRKYEFYKDRKTQSPSKLILDSVFEKLKNEGVVDFKCTHLIGEPITFVSLEEALEYYMNFHMESVFNNSDDLEEIINELSDDLVNYREDDGSIKINPGCFIYEVKKK